MHLCIAFAAIYRTVRLGLKGNSCFSAAGSTNSSEILARTARCVLASIAAGLATLGLVLETTLSIKFLFTSGKHELLSTLFAYQCLVLEHVSVIPL